MGQRKRRADGLLERKRTIDGKVVRLRAIPQSMPDAGSSLLRVEVAKSVQAARTKGCAAATDMLKA